MLPMLLQKNKPSLQVAFPYFDPSLGMKFRALITLPLRSRSITADHLEDTYTQAHSHSLSEPEFIPPCSVEATTMPLQRWHNP
jgi:hypothetical protein